MNKFFKQEKGINLISLTITIIIILIITGILIFNARDSIYIKNLQNMYNDISTLREKVSLYYSQYGAIPAKYEFNNIGNLQSAGVIGANDTGKFYIIDLKALPSLTLNYGKDYYKAEEENSDINSLEDVYIINETSHNIFYVQGVSVKSGDTTKVYYTDEENIDTAEVDIKPISTNEILPGELVTGENKDYENNGKAKIPVGFMIVPGVDDVSKGLVISDNPEDTEEDPNNIVAKGNQFVWIPVDKDTLCVDGIKGTEIAEKVSEKSEDYRGVFYNIDNGIPEKKEYDPTQGREPDVLGQGSDFYDNKIKNLEIMNKILTNTENNFIKFTNADDFKTYLQAEYNDIINSIKINGGFYIARYESSLSSSDKTTDGETGNIQSKRNVLPADATKSGSNTWYGLYAKQKEFASTLEGTTVKSSMIYGSMYDALLNWVLNDENEKEKITEEIINRGEKCPTGTEVEKGKYDKIKNIYDLRNNLMEWTAEAGGYDFRVLIPNDYIEGTGVTAYSYWLERPDNPIENQGSRMILYL